MSIIKGTDTIVAGFGGTKRSIGEVYFSQSALATDNSGALPLFTGETIASANTIYPEFYNWVLAHTELQCTSAEYESALSTYGECAKYVIGGGSLRLPLIKNYIKEANTSDTVTPASTTLYPWVVAYTAAIPASTAQAAEFQQGLSGKVDLPVGKTQSDVDFVVESYSDDSGNWYRVYKSGWVEQGGLVQGNGSYGFVTVTLHKPMANNTYHINSYIFWGASDWYTSTQAVGEAATTDITGVPVNATVTSFQIQSYSGHRWSVCGQGAN